jgi:hypothetical protein
MLLLLTLRRQDFLKKCFFKTAFYGLLTELEPELYTGAIIFSHGLQHPRSLNRNLSNSEPEP